MALILQDYYTVSQFAALCRCTRRTVYRWMDDKLIDYDSAPGGVHYIPKTKGEEFAKQWKKRHGLRLASSDANDRPPKTSKASEVNGQV